VALYFIPAPPQYVFMASCLVKHRGNFAFLRLGLLPCSDLELSYEVRILFDILVGILDGGSAHRFRCVGFFILVMRTRDFRLLLCCEMCNCVLMCHHRTLNTSV
jgi:hypothetical protein